jgi:microcystin-dependent protein
MLLIDPLNFEQSGSLTPEQTTSYFEEMFDAWLNGGCDMFPGMVIASAGSASPSAHWLLCDGASYARASYPALYNAIGSAFGAVDGSHFNVPDLVGRVPLGVGSGAGLTPRALAASGGEEAHQLIAAEIPAHTHTLASTILSGGTTSGNLIVSNGLAPASPATSSIGGDGAHNTMQPWLALNFYIFTG